MDDTFKPDHPSEALLGWESWAGEVRVNLIRILAIAIFYAHHLVRVYLWKDVPLEHSSEIRIATLVISYGLVVAALYFVLRLEWLHPSVKYLVTFWDTLMIGILIAMMGGPRSVFPMLLVLPIAASVLRLSLPLVYFSTIAAAITYLMNLAYYAWFVIGGEKYYGDTTARIPRSEQIVVLLVLVTAGLLAGQAVRQIRRIVQSLRSAKSGQS